MVALSVVAEKVGVVGSLKGLGFGAGVVVKKSFWRSRESTGAGSSRGINLLLDSYALSPS